jgi:hypothetical protein
MPVLADNKKKNTRKRTVKVLALTAALVVAGGTAFAWWTAGGTGTGSASTGSVTGITVNQTSSVTGLYPGGPAATLAGNFTNGNSGKVYVAQVSVVIQENWSASADENKPACTAADYELEQPTATNAEIPTGTGGSWGNGSIKLLDREANQDNCKNVTVPLVYTSN